MFECLSIFIGTADDSDAKKDTFTARAGIDMVGENLSVIEYI
jgi:nicotinamide mononucleotide adenylyltransferase